MATSMRTKRITIARQSIVANSHYRKLLVVLRDHLTDEEMIRAELDILKVIEEKFLSVIINAVNNTVIDRLVAKFIKNQVDFAKDGDYTTVVSFGVAVARLPPKISVLSVGDQETTPPPRYNAHHIQYPLSPPAELPAASPALIPPLPVGSPRKLSDNESFQDAEFEEKHGNTIDRNGEDSSDERNNMRSKPVISFFAHGVVPPPKNRKKYDYGYYEMDHPDRLFNFRTESIIRSIGEGNNQKNSRIICTDQPNHARVEVITLNFNKKSVVQTVHVRLLMEYSNSSKGPLTATDGSRLTIELRGVHRLSIGKRMTKVILHFTGHHYAVTARLIDMAESNILGFGFGALYGGRTLSYLSCVEINIY